ncbi:MAG: 30S ribosomal protein S18 [Bdellovibrionales bacterium]
MKKSSKSKYRQEFSGDHHFDYKDPVSLTRFIGDGGKIVPARISKLSIAQQKKVAAAVRKARSLGLLPSGMEHFDNMQRQEAVNPVPFEI